LRVIFGLSLAAVRARLDLLHAQYVAPPVLPCPFVVTVHDLVWLHYPETLPWTMGRRLRHLVPWTVQRARRVCTPSHAIKHEVMERYDVAEDRIDVVSPATEDIMRPCADPGLIETVRDRYGIGPDYVLYVGAIQPRKNLGRLARAFAAAVQRGAPHQLVVTGKRMWLYKALIAEIESLGLEDRVVWTGYVGRNDLPILMSGCSAFAYVSLYEGFGLPVLEAMACGAPVLTSTDPALQEVAQGNAVHADPESIEEIQEGLASLLFHDHLSQRLREAGPEKAARYSRTAMARAALDCYARALTSARGA
jgi:glycosyltransferase involved in cell wall biosynthesis